MSEVVFTVDEVAELLKVSRPTVYRLMREGKLHYVTVGEQRRIPKTALEKLIGPFEIERGEDQKNQTPELEAVA